MIHSKSFEPRVSNAGVCNQPVRAARAFARSASRWPLVGTLVAALVFPNLARAEGNATVPDPLAITLFQAGRELVDKGEWTEGCQKFEASMALYPAASTLLNIARCYEHDGKLTLAWTAYQRAIVINRETQGEERKKALDEVAKKGLADIEARLPRLKLVTKGGAPTALRVTHNGKDVPVALLGTVIPVDPGKQSVIAEAPGFETFAQNFAVAEGELIEIIIALKRPAPEVVQSRGVPTWAWISGGAGLALLAGSAAFRVDQAFVEGKQIGLCRGDLKGGCPPESEYDPAPDNSRKNRDYGLFLGLGTAGLVGIGAAVVGIVMGGQPAKKPSSATTATLTPWIGPTSVGAGIGGRF